jgi:hypothetical protein
MYAYQFVARAGPPQAQAGCRALSLHGSPSFWPTAQNSPGAHGQLEAQRRRHRRRRWPGSDSDGGSPSRPGLRDLPRVRRSLSGGTSGGASATDPPRPATMPLSARNPPGPAAGPVVGQLQFAFKVAAPPRRSPASAQGPGAAATADLDLRGQCLARAGHRGRGHPPPPASRRPSDSESRSPATVTVTGGARWPPPSRAGCSESS